MVTYLPPLKSNLVSKYQPIDDSWERSPKFGEAHGGNNTNSQRVAGRVEKQGTRHKGRERRRPPPHRVRAGAGAQTWAWAGRKGTASTAERQLSPGRVLQPTGLAKGVLPTDRREPTQRGREKKRQNSNDTPERLTRQNSESEAGKVRPEDQTTEWNGQTVHRRTLEVLPLQAIANARSPEPRGTPPWRRGPAALTTLPYRTGPGDRREQLCPWKMTESLGRLM